MQRNRLKLKIREILRIQPSPVEIQRNRERRMVEPLQRNRVKLKILEILELPRIQLSLADPQRTREQRPVEIQRRNPAPRPAKTQKKIRKRKKA